MMYKKGKDSLVADTLSRCHERDNQCNTLHTIIPLWKKELKESWKNDSLAQELYASLLIGNKNDQGYELIDDELKKEGKLYVGSGNSLRKQIIQNSHKSAEGGHSGVIPTFKIIQELFS